MKWRSLVAGIAVACVGCCVSLPAAAARGADPVAIVGGSPVQRELARTIALRVGGVTIGRVVFRRGGAELVVVSKPVPNSLTLRADWEAQLYAGTYLALAQRCPRAKVGAVVAAHSEGPADRWPAYDLWSKLPRARAVAALAARLDQAATTRGAQVVGLKIATAPARAIAVTLRVHDPAAFLKHRGASFLELLSTPHIRLLGYYVGLEDAGGHLVWATSRLPNEGSVFATRRLDACSPVWHSEPVGAKQLPCPAR